MILNGKMPRVVENDHAMKFGGYCVIAKEGLQQFSWFQVQLRLYAVSFVDGMMLIVSTPDLEFVLYKSACLLAPWGKKRVRGTWHSIPEVRRKSQCKISSYNEATFLKQYKSRPLAHAIIPVCLCLTLKHQSLALNLQFRAWKYKTKGETRYRVTL